MKKIIKGIRKILKLNKLIDYEIKNIKVIKQNNGKYGITIYFNDIDILHYSGERLHFNGDISLSSHNIEWWGSIAMSLSKNEVGKALNIIENFEKKRRKAKNFILENLKEVMLEEKLAQEEKKLYKYM